MTPDELKESARQEAIARIRGRLKSPPLVTEGVGAVDPIHKKYEAEIEEHGIQIEVDEILKREAAPLKMANPLVGLASIAAATLMPYREPMRVREFALSNAERKHKAKAKLKRRQQKASRRRNRD